MVIINTYIRRVAPTEISARTAGEEAEWRGTKQGQWWEIIHPRITLQLLYLVALHISNLLTIATIHNSCLYDLKFLTSYRKSIYTIQFLGSKYRCIKSTRTPTKAFIYFLIYDDWWIFCASLSFTEIYNVLHVHLFAHLYGCICYQGTSDCRSA